MTQADLSKRTGLTRSHISQIENGRVRIQMNTLELIVQGLRITFVDLFDGVAVGDIPSAE